MVRKEKDRFGHQFDVLDGLVYLLGGSIICGTMFQTCQSSKRWNNLGYLLEETEVAYVDVNHDGRKDMITKDGLDENYFFLQKKDGEYEKVTNLNQYLKNN